MSCITSLHQVNDPDALADSKDLDYHPNKAAVLFRASWDYIPVPILKLIKYMPVSPWPRVRSLNNLFREYGKRIIREQGSDVDTEKVPSKDILSILSKHPNS